MLDVSQLGVVAGERGRGSTDKTREVCGWMVALNGAHKGEDFRLRVGKNVIGTAADCDIVLTDKKISRKHATIRYEGGEFQIADLDSSNGTHVNDEKVQKHDLIDNDIIKLGDIEFEFKCRAMRQHRD
jgi:pSer/pThr/pTyr-binding forkhead associated (FHA) protein